MILAGPPVKDREGAFGYDAPVEIGLKDFSFVAVDRCCVPDEGIAGGSEERVEVRGHERAQFDELAGQSWLQVGNPRKCSNNYCNPAAAPMARVELLAGGRGVRL